MVSMHLDHIVCCCLAQAGGAYALAPRHLHLPLRCPLPLCRTMRW